MTKTPKAKLEKTREQQKRRAELIVVAKSGPCVDCGRTYPPYVMDFDHVTGDKKFRLAQGWTSHGIESILEEISKCELVCANCHRERTHRRSLKK